MGNRKGEKITGRGAISKLQTTGESAACSGLYQIEHNEHQFQQELFIIKGAHLPPCPVCGNTATFRLVEKIHHIAEDPDFY